MRAVGKPLAGARRAFDLRVRWRRLGPQRGNFLHTTDTEADRSALSVVTLNENATGSDNSAVDIRRLLPGRTGHDDPALAAGCLQPGTVGTANLADGADLVLNFTAADSDASLVRLTEPVKTIRETGGISAYFTSRIRSSCRICAAFAGTIGLDDCATLIADPP
jgi:hypothetical protein